MLARWAQDQQLVLVRLAPGLQARVLPELGQQVQEQGWQEPNQQVLELGLPLVRDWPVLVPLEPDLPQVQG